MIDFDLGLSDLKEKLKNSDASAEMAEEIAETAQKLNEVLTPSDELKNLRSVIHHEDSEENRLFKQWQDTANNRLESEIPLNDKYWEHRETYRAYKHAKVGQ